MRDWLIRKLGGYPRHEALWTLDDFLNSKLDEQIFNKKAKTVNVYDSDYGSFVVKVELWKDGKKVKPLKCERCGKLSL